MKSGDDALRFIFGFVGIVTLGLTTLVAVGYYQVQFSGSVTTSGAGARTINLER